MAQPYKNECLIAIIVIDLQDILVREGDAGGLQGVHQQALREAAAPVGSVPSAQADGSGDDEGGEDDCTPPEVSAGPVSDWQATKSAEVQGHMMNTCRCQLY
jgi:hypothetical protein